MTVEYTLRAAVPADGAFIYRVCELTSRGLVEASSRRWAESCMREKCNADANDPHTRIVQVAGNDCGVFTLESRAVEHWLHMLFLLPEFQRQGIGRGLMQVAQARARAVGLPLRLQLMRNNPARIFYEKLGFSVYVESDEFFFMQSLP